MRACHTFLIESRIGSSWTSIFNLYDGIFKEAIYI